MLKNISNLKGIRELGQEDQRKIVGAAGGCNASFCDAEGNCPTGSTCNNGICECDSSGGPGGPGCNEPIRICQPEETGCGCVYI
ncbi:hypothetical protein SAMN02927921_04151 [Sinomicrobium oceani]|uniref:Uncharacterized protein n=1 Tax=Sinomicrobium oceani TaxID=1150368 RepID=A0A1K1RX64_9FLAO|nr:hypothetical protein SAMN02927921_04151 [Sinomicrobium oceani]